MKKSSLKKTCITGLVVGLAVMPGLASAGESWTYTGIASDRLTIDGTTNSIGPKDLTNVTGNTITVNYTPNGSNEVTELYGGYGVITRTQTVSGNSINLSNGIVTHNAYGGYAYQGDVINNKATIGSGTVKHDVYGGYGAGVGNVTGNTVEIGGGTVEGDVYGGSSYGSAGLSISNNRVIISGGILSNNVYGALTISSGVTSTGNSVTINEDNALVTVNSNVYGSSASYSPVEGNSVTIDGGTIKGYVSGGYSAHDSANTNNVTITGGSVARSVYGGMSIDDNATGNSVTISGGTVYGDVYGGHSTARNATGNSVTISGSPDLVYAILYGGYTGGLTGDAFTGNTLNVKSSGMTAKGVANFQKYNFYLPEDLANGGTMLTVTQAADVSNATIGVGINGPTTALHPGDRVTLLATGGLTADGINNRAVGLQGIARMYDFDLTTDVNNLYATVAGSSGPGPRLNPQTKALSEGQISAAAFLNQGADILSGQGLKNALSAADGAGGQASGFAAMGGSKLRYETGSHVDVNGFSLVLGAARQIAGADSTRLSGLFMESGWGNYSTYNNFVNAASVRGDGDTRYFGAGWLGRYQKNHGRYLEGSLRFGKVSNEFSSNDIGLTGTNSRFDISAPYYGMHIGFGKETDFGNNKQDVYTKLLWTHQNGSHATVQGDAFDFGAINSYRWQLGTKWLHKTNAQTTVRTGLAYQYEFDGEANATAYGMNIDAPSMKGSTGIVEVGLTQESKDGKGAKLDFGLQGFFGKMRGVAGNIQATWEF